MRCEGNTPAGHSEIQLSRQRVLVEDPDVDWHRFAAEGLDGDYELEFCGGPQTLPDGCPLLDGRTCAKAERADVILNTLALGQPENRRLVEELRRRYPDRLVELLAGCAVG
jgi:hypothetical protein